MTDLRTPQGEWRLCWVDSGWCNDMDYLLDRGGMVPVEPDYTRMAIALERIFGPDVRFANHPDQMSDDDWLSLAKTVWRAGFGETP